MNKTKAFWSYPVIDKKIKLCVIGNGTMGAVALLNIGSLIKSLNSEYIEVYCIHDPSIPHMKIGEGSSASLLPLLRNSIEFNILKDMDYINATVKWGVVGLWKKASGENFYIETNSPSLHIDSELFSTHILKTLKKIYKNVIEVQDKVLSVNQNNVNVNIHCSKKLYTFDYVFDCRGTPSPEDLNNGDYLFPDFQGVNSIIAFPDPNFYNEQYTSIHVHNNGWMFGIPLKHKKTWGYLYNNKITTKEKAIKNFLNINKNINPELLRTFSWAQYYRKRIVDNRILYLGNRLFLLDPTGALPMHYVFEITTHFLTALFSPHNQTSFNIAEQANKLHLNNMLIMQDLIALNYAGKNNINSVYWKKTKKEAHNKLKNSEFFQKWIKSHNFTIDINKAEQVYNQYWKHEPAYITNIIKGFQVDLNELLA
jgi:hypothetical protein